MLVANGDDNVERACVYVSSMLANSVVETSGSSVLFL